MDLHNFHLYSTLTQAVPLLLNIHIISIHLPCSRFIDIRLAYEISMKMIYLCVEIIWVDWNISQKLSIYHWVRCNVNVWDSAEKQNNECAYRNVQ